MWAGHNPWPAGAPPKAERPGRLRYRNSLPLPMVDRVIRMFSSGPDSGAAPWSSLVADPFLGGGTTAIAALANQRRFAGADVNPDALRFATARITVETPYHAPTSLLGGNGG